MTYVRHKAFSPDEYWFATKQLMEEEEKGITITRTIISDFGQPIGTINLFDVENGAGFLGTWLGTPFQGLGYNKKAKQQFLEELFYELGIHTVFLRIRKNNPKSIRATEKLKYAMNQMKHILLSIKKSTKMGMFTNYSIFQKICSTS